MTPQQKAKELVEKMCAFQVVHQYDEDGEFIKRAKQCALIAVDEILKIYEHVDENIIKRNEKYRPLDEYAYWQQVKEEIEKL